MGDIEMMVKMGAAVGAMVAAAALIFFTIAKALGIRRRESEQAPQQIAVPTCPAPEVLARHEQHSAQLASEILRFQEREATMRREEHTKLVSIMEKQTQLMTRLVTIQELRGLADRPPNRIPE